MTGFVLLVFVAVYLGMALGRWPGLQIDRTGIALVGAILLYLGGAVGGERALAAIDFPTLVVLFGLMVLSAQYAACGFYAWCSRRIAGAACGPRVLLGLTVAVAGLLSAVLANDVVVFAMTPLLCIGLRRRGLDPRPFLIALTAAANAGSAATLIGNPQNILIGQTGDLDFLTFSSICAVPALMGLVITCAVILRVWRGRFELGPGAEIGGGGPGPGLDRAGLGKAALATVVLLALFTTPLPHVEGVLLVAGVLLVSRRLSTKRLLGLVDWHLLVLFGGLFVVTAAVAETGLAARALAWLDQVGWGIGSLPVLAGLSLIGSNTIGNVPLVVLLLAVGGPAAPEQLHALAVLTTLSGNLLLTGSLANIITVERAREVGVSLSFAEHARCGIPIALLSIAAALAWLGLAVGG